MSRRDPDQGSRSGPDSLWGSAPWRVELRLPEVELPQRVEVAIVGGGLTGLAAARRLALAGCETAVLEAGRIGAGASARTGGLVLEHTAAGALPGTENCTQAMLELIEQERLACDLLLAGCDELLHRPDDDSPPGWRDDGASLVVARQVPGGTVDPGRLLEGLARAARGAGAILHENEPVLGLEPGPEATLFVGNRELVARHVLVAAGAYATELLPLPLRLQRALTLAVALAPVDLRALGLARGRGFYTEDLPYLWGRALGEDAAIFGSGWLAAPPGDPLAIRLDEPRVARAFEQLLARVRGLHPALGAAHVTHRWGGPVAVRDGGYPLIARHPDLPQLIVATGYAGHGVALAVRAADWIARAMLEQEPLPEGAGFDPVDAQKPLM
jgi:gamma-glutamylputrescine oxidase